MLNASVGRGYACAVGFTEEIVIWYDAVDMIWYPSQDWSAQYWSDLGGGWSVGNALNRATATIINVYGDDMGYDSHFYRGNGGTVL